VELAVAGRHGVVAEVAHGFQDRFAERVHADVPGLDRIPGIESRYGAPSNASIAARNRAAPVSFNLPWKSLVCKMWSVNRPVVSESTTR
jgi:hypothetical protein